MTWHPAPASALITGGAGAKPVADPGWPAGAVEIANYPLRVAYWEGPPFGGGEWHGEYRGSAEDMNAVLIYFANMQGERKQVVLHDGVGRSFWLNPNNDAKRREAAEIDWTFVVWQPQAWERMVEMPAFLRAQGATAEEKEAGPPSRIDVYCGGGIDWDKVDVPDGLEIVDNRLSAHGFSAQDGAVLEGDVRDAETDAPIAAQIRLESHTALPEGGYEYKTVTEIATDASGHWVIKNAPKDGRRIIAQADRYAARVVGYVSGDEGPHWELHNTTLSPLVEVSGRVTDTQGQPLEDATVRLDVTLTKEDLAYRTPDDLSVVTDADGAFKLAAPKGVAHVVFQKTGHVPVGAAREVTTPFKDLTLQLTDAAAVTIRVQFPPGAKPEEYVVEIEPEGGTAVGTWGGSAQVDAEGERKFESVPPGTYVVWGHPNPWSSEEETERKTVELTAGKTTEVVLDAK